MTVIITPVGTSLFTNGSESSTQIKNRFQSIKDKCASDWNSYSAYIKLLRQHSEQFIRTEGQSASAELQSTDRIQNALKAEITVHLLASDTIASRLAAEVLNGQVASGSLSNQVTIHFNQNQDVIKGLQVESRTNFLKTGMNALIKRINEINSNLGGNQGTLAINITGGYGATLPYLTIFAQLKRVPLYYNFEDSNELIKIPPTPLTIDWDLIGPNFEVLEKINNGDALEKWSIFKQKNYAAVQELQPFILVDQNDNSAYLSPLGEVFWDECLKLKLTVSFPTPVTTPPDEIENVGTEIKDSISGKPHHRPQGWEQFVKRLCENAYVKYVRYDSTVYGGGDFKVLDNGENGDIGVRYSKGDETLPLRVETSARGNAQTELVMNFIKRQLSPKK